jgi:hypothetical protein
LKIILKIEISNRELFGVHPTGINFELYDDIPVEASHMDHAPIDTVCILKEISFTKFVYLIV